MMLELPSVILLKFHEESLLDLGFVMTLRLTRIPDIKACSLDRAFAA